MVLVIQIIEKKTAFPQNSTKSTTKHCSISIAYVLVFEMHALPSQVEVNFTLLTVEFV